MPAIPNHRRGCVGQAAAVCIGYRHDALARIPVRMTIEEYLNWDFGDARARLAPL